MVLCTVFLYILTALSDDRDRSFSTFILNSFVHDTQIQSPEIKMSGFLIIQGDLNSLLSHEETQRPD